MPTYGLTTEGFVPKTTEIMRDELDAAAREAFGASIPLGDKTLFGHINAILAEQLAILWELAEAINAAQDPDAATGANLEALALLTGTFRRAAAYSTVTLTLCGTPATVVPAGSVVNTSLVKGFETSAEGTITALAVWVNSTAYVVGDRRYTPVNRCYECITAGTSHSGATNYPTTTSADITDGTAHWQYIGEGTGAIDVEANSVDTGEIVGGLRDITEIQNPVAGWSSCINLAAATLGRDEDTDETLRLRREADLAAIGTSTPDAIRQAILAVDTVTNVTVFYNETDTTDGDGVPPHSVECLVQGGTDQDIWNALLANVAAGIGTYGAEAGTATDDEGTAHDMNFSRPDEIEIYVDITITKDPDLYPSDGDDQVEAAIIAWGDAQEVGRNATPSTIAAQAFTVAGVLEVTAIGIDTVAILTPTTWAGTTAYTSSPSNIVINEGRVYRCITAGTSAGSGGPSTTSADITDGTAHWRYLGAVVDIDTRELATYLTSRIAVHSTDATP